MLTSQAREALRGVETVIVDEVHAVAGTKRGAHLALSLERLDALLDQPGPAHRPVRDGPPGRGGRPLPRRRRARSTVVQPPSGKTIDLSVVVPVEDMGELGAARPARSSGSAAGAERAPRSGRTSRSASSTSSQAHRSTIVFANSRRLAERLCARLNEIAYERATGEPLPEPGDPPPAAADGAGRVAGGAPRRAPTR